MASLKYYNKNTNQWEYVSSGSSSDTNDILIDNTLTQAGQAADAKSVGDRLTEFEKKVNSNVFVADDGDGNINVEIFTSNISVADDGSGNITLF